MEAAAEYGRMTILGEPPTKKNSQVAVAMGLWGGRGLKRFLQLAVEHLEALTDYHQGSPLRYREALEELERVALRRQVILSAFRESAAKMLIRVLPNDEYRSALKWWPPQARRAWGRRPMVGTESTPVHVRALYYLPARKTPDLLSLEEATADLLEEAGVLANDYWIRSWDESDVFRDPRNPRTELVLRPFIRRGDQRCLTLPPPSNPPS